MLYHPPVAGNTPLRKLPALCKLYGISNLLVKDESVNPTGTHKDRRSQLVAKDAGTLHPDKLVIITSANSGISLARACRLSGAQIVCIVDSAMKKETKNRLSAQVHRVIEKNLSTGILLTEQTIALARESEHEVIWDVTNNYHEAYMGLVAELVNVQPSHIIVPVGSGELFVGLYIGLKKYGLNSRLVGIGVSDPNSVADKLYAKWTPYETVIKSIARDGHIFARGRAGCALRHFKICLILAARRAFRAGRFRCFRDV